MSAHPGETRECPFCAEVIKTKAIKCKHCGSFLTEDALTHVAQELARLREPAPVAGETPSSEPSAFAVPAAGTIVAPDPASTAEGAARLATVVFADLSGFTALTGTYEPEEMREIMNALFSDLAGAVERFGGRVDKYIGDCVMAVWGTEQARAEDPARAANAALSMLHRMKGRAGRLSLPLALHVGVATGRVIFGRVGVGEGATATVLGDCVNLAARLCAAAPTGEVYASEDTWRRVSDRFASRTVDLDLKGIGPVRAYAVVPGTGRSRVTRRVVMDFHGREVESGRITAMLEALVEGAPRRRAGVLVVGPGGVGKSRLAAHSLAHFDRGREIRTCFAQAVPAETPAFGTYVAAWLADLMGGGDAEAIDHFFTARPGLAPHRPAVHMIFASAEQAGLVGGFAADRPIDEVVADVFLEVSNETPLVLAAADVQWTDELSLDVCRALAAATAAGRGRIGLVIDGRPGPNTDRLSAAPGMEIVDLGLLSLDAMEHVLAGILDTPAPRDWVRRVRERTGGVFMHFSQVLDALAEAEVLVEDAAGGRWRLASPDRELPVPASLQDLIWLRIERLPTWQREVLLHASVCGLRFPRRILEIAIGRNAEDLAEPLSMLDQDGFLTISTGETLAFAHGSIRETARRILLQAERRRIAERILSRIEERLSEDVLRPLAPDLFRDAGRTLDLRSFLAADAYRLVRSFRLDEARRLLDTVGRGDWPDTAAGARAQAIYLSASSRLSEARHDLENAFALQRNAVALLRQCAPNTVELVRNLGLLSRIAAKREDWKAATAFGQESLETSHAIGDELGQGIQIWMLGWIAEQQGDWTTAHGHFRDSLSFARTDRGLRVSHGSVGRAAIELGRIDEAREHGRIALESAHRDNAIQWNPHAYVSILSTTGRVAWRDHDVAATFLHLGTALDLARATADDEAQLMILLPLVEIATEAGKRDIARVFAAAAIAAAERIGYPRWRRRVEQCRDRIDTIPPAGDRPAGSEEVTRLLSVIRAGLEQPPRPREEIQPVGRASGTTPQLLC